MISSETNRLEIQASYQHGLVDLLQAEILHVLASPLSDAINREGGI